MPTISNQLNQYIQVNFPNFYRYLREKDPEKGYILMPLTATHEMQFAAEKPEKLNNSLQLTDMLCAGTETDRYTVPAAFLYAAMNTFGSDTINTDGLPKTVCEIADSVFKFPDIGKMNFTEESDNFIKLLLTVMGDVRAVIIRLHEQLRRTRNAAKADTAWQKKIAGQNFAVFAPAAHRIGLYKLKEELENLSLLFRKPDVYHGIEKKLEGTKADREAFIGTFIAPLKADLDKAGYSYKIKWRTKSVFSIWNKMLKKKVSFDEVYDLFAIRIILDSEGEAEIRDCWNAYSIVVQHYRPDTSRLRDWISFPKSSGYESLQTTVYAEGGRPVEVQIRTVRMDDIAENGPAAHWKYKGAEKGNTNLWLEKMREAIEHPDKDDTEKITSGLKAPEIFVLSPKGDLLKLTKGHTVIDLAFSIHSNLGEYCTGAMVNGHIQPVSYEPKNGDKIQILTDKNNRISEDRLKIAKSPRSKAKIKRALRIRQYNRAEEGKELLKSKLTQLKYGFGDEVLQKIVKAGNFDSYMEMFHAYAVGKADIKNLKQIFEEGDITESPDLSLPPEHLSEEEKHGLPSGDYLLIDSHLTTIDYTMAKCCKPLPGDKIFGFVTVSKGTKIHKTNCPNAKDLRTRYPYRVVKAVWNIGFKDGEFMAEISVKGTDRTGIAAALSKLVSEEFDLKLKAIALKTGQNDSFSGTLAVKVHSRKQMNDLLLAIRRLEGISHVREKYNT